MSTGRSDHPATLIVEAWNGEPDPDHGWEVGLLIGRWLAIVALLMVAHLSGTFLVLVTQPHVAFQHGDPLMLTMTGEFVVKNIVLITAGLVLIGRIQRAEAADHA